MNHRDWDNEKDGWEQGYIEGVYSTIKSIIDVAEEHNKNGIGMYDLKKLLVAFTDKYGDKLDR